MKPLVREGIEAYKAGDKAKARQLLSQAVKEDQDDAEAWYYLAATQSDLEQRKYCLEMVIKIDPGNAKAQEMLEKTNAHLAAGAGDMHATGISSQSMGSASGSGPQIGGFKLPVEIPGAPDKVSPQELISDGIALLKNSIGIFLKRSGAYEDEIRRATWWRFWLTVATGSVVSAILFAIGTLFLELRYASVLASMGYAPNLFTPVLTLIFSIPINMAAVYAGSYASHWYATKQAGGSASLVQHSHTMAAAWLPASVLGAFLGAIVTLLFGTTVSANMFFFAGGAALAALGLGVLIAIIVSIGVSLYTLSILVKGIQVLYKFIGSSLWITTIVMLIVTGLVYGILDGIFPG